MKSGVRACILLGCGALVLACSSGASAAPPVYFHKAGVDRQTFATDYGVCAELAGGVNAPAPIGAYSPNMYAQAANAFFNGFFQSGEKRRLTENVLRTCMADKGYRRVRATAAMMRELRAVSDRERVDRLFALASAAAPTGEVLPR